MRELIQQIFKAYGFGEKWQDDSIEFYAAESEDKHSRSDRCHDERDCLCKSERNKISG